MLQGSLGPQTKVHGKLCALYHGPLGPKETKITRQKILFVLKFPKSHTRMGLQYLLIKVTYMKFKVTGMISQGH